MTPALDFLPERGEVAALIRSKDWTRTPLGPPETWSPSLRTVLRLMLTSRFAMWMGWGPQLTFFYNDAYAVQTLGAKHPSVLGLPFAEVWAEIWDTLKVRIAHVLGTGEATWDQGLLLFLERSGYAEETYHTFSYSPAPGDVSGHVAGLLCVVIEETERVIGERRIALLQDLAARLAQTNSTRDVIGAVEGCLTANSRDIPFALIYLFEDGDGFARRASQTNFEPGHPASPDRVAVGSAPWPFASILSKATPEIVELTGEQAWPTGDWARPPTHALLVPIALQGKPRPAGVFVAGVNPHRPLDKGFQSFVELFVGQLAAALSNARAYEDEKNRADALAEVDRAKTAFFSNVSHEFRTPLTLMLGPTEDALSSPERALRGADLETVHRNELRLLKLVNALLDFARLEAGRTQASYEPTDLAALTTDLSSSFRSAIERAGLEFDVDCEATEPIYVDHDMWEKIVLNMLSNALKFTFEGRISVALGLQGDSAVLTVRDTGVGIPASELPRLFERFHRIEGGRARTHEGSGIGLALVQDLVRLHEGRIDVTSTVDEGTTFTISIPRGTAHLPPDRVGTTRMAPSSSLGRAYVAEALRWIKAVDASPPPEPQPSANRARIVVADDNADMRDYIARLLRERWDVETAENGHAALDAIRRSSPDLVLSDVMMPGLDGFALLRSVRADAVLRSVPVILLSARAGEEAAAEGLNAGADDYIVKPFAARDLVVRVASRLAAARAAREAATIKENLYRHFMQAPFPIAVFRGPEHLVELANNATLRAWGKTPEEAVGRPLRAVLPVLSDQPFLAYLDEVLRTGIAYNGRAELARLPTGPGGAVEEAYFTFAYAPLLDARGAIEGVLVSAYDVTPQIRSQQEVERARDEAERLAFRLSNTSERLRAAQQIGGIGIFDWDLKTKAIHWSPELYALMGLADGAIAPTPEGWTERLFEESDRAAGWGAFNEAVTNRKSAIEVEVRLRQPDGGSRWVRLSSDIQYDDGGRPTRLLGAVVDIQLLKEAAAARLRALAEAEKTGRAKDEFLATMSHELRTPLNAMLGWAKMLRRDRVDPQKVEHGLAVIERNAETQARLISDLLDVSRIISGKLRLTVQRVSVTTVIHAAVDVVRQAADAKGVQLVVNLDADVGAIIGDPDRLQQIVWNLLSNAVKFTSGGGVVTVSARRQDSTVSIRVHDTGAGIKAEHLPLIFERFQQVDSTTTREHGGLGLGLAIVRHLAEAHGGTVNAQSQGLGWGSTFTVSLPLRAVLVEAGSTHGEASLIENATMQFKERRQPLRALHILIVDDDEDSLDLLRVVLDGAGASVTSTTRAASAIEISQRTRFDLVISDIGMPEMDGYGFMQALRARNSEIPAIALTAYARAEDAKHAHEAGYQHHIAKPVDANALVGAIERLLSSPGE
jgi:signal transduction histidine kinase/DNA-binding response OmpR family regulator